MTILGIVLGVAVFVGMHTANQSVLAAFRQTIDRIAGSTQLKVSAGEPGCARNTSGSSIASSEFSSSCLTNQDLRQYVIRVTDQWFGLTYVQIAVAVLVAVLGIVRCVDSFNHGPAPRARRVRSRGAGCAGRSVTPSGWRRWESA